MKKINSLLMLLPLLVLFGCADSHTTGTEKDTDLEVTIYVTQHANNTGDVNINPGVDFASATGDTKQDTANTAETPTKVDLNLDDVNNPTTKITNAVEDKVKSNIEKDVADIQGGQEPEDSEIADNDDLAYETRFHHTTWDPDKKKDGGISLYSCPGQVWEYDSCKSGEVDIPLHSKKDEDGREGWWNMFKAPPAEDIICTKNGKNFKYRADELIIYGNCE